MPISRFLMLSCLSLAATACGSTPPPKPITVVKVETVREPIPDEYLTCPDEPAPLPAKPRPSNRQMARWFADALEAGAHCRADVQATRDLEIGRRGAFIPPARPKP